MYYTGLDPRTMEPVYVARNPHEKAMQRALIQFRDPKNYALVTEALRKAGREDLIGYGPHCLVRPRTKRADTATARTAQRSAAHPVRQKTAPAPQQRNKKPASGRPAPRPAYEKSLKHPRKRDGE